MVKTVHQRSNIRKYGITEAEYEVEDDINRLQAAIEYLVSTVAPTEWSFSAARTEVHKSVGPNMARALSGDSLRKRSESLKTKWANPAFKARMRDIQKVAQNKPEVKARMIASCTKHANTDEGRATRVKAGKKRQELARAEQQ
jgi:hypothetical protein